MLEAEVTDEDRYALRQRLLGLRHSSGDSLYVIMDMARDPFLLPAVLEGFNVECQCLFRGQAKEELGDQTAWIARIDDQQGLLDWLLDEGWNKRIASFVLSPLPIHRLTSHLRKFTKVRDVRGREHFFRFYDPQVLRQYLPVFGPREHEMFFRSISCCAIEDTRRPDRMLIGCSSDGKVEWEEWLLKARHESQDEQGSLTQSQFNTKELDDAYRV